MNELTFKASNIKCMGCVNNILEGLQGLPGVQSVEVELETGQVVIGGDALSAQVMTDKLASLGYPVA